MDTDEGHSAGDEHAAAPEATDAEPGDETGHDGRALVTTPVTTPIRPSDQPASTRAGVTRAYAAPAPT